jgi:hypothetical protein
MKGGEWPASVYSPFSWIFKTLAPHGITFYRKALKKERREEEQFAGCHAAGIGLKLFIAFFAIYQRNA